MNMQTEEIAGSIGNSVRVDAFGTEISLLHFKEDEWKNVAQSGKAVIEKLGKLLETIKKSGPNSSYISDTNRVKIINKSLKKDSRFYKAIKDTKLTTHYEFRLKQKKMRVLMSFEQDENKGYLICFDHNHRALNTGK